MRLQCLYCERHVGVISLAKDGTLIDFYDDVDAGNTKYIIWELKQSENGTKTNLARRMVEMSERKCSVCGMEQEAHKESAHEFTIKIEMTREEKLFAKFFSEEKILVHDMDDMALKAHIEELQEIAKEARARLTASNEEAQERSASKKKAKGFAVALEPDDFTSNAINNIKKRGEKLTKVEKEIERLVAMGMAREDAENMYRAVTINKVQKEGGAAVVEDNKRLDVLAIVNSVMAGPNPSEPKEFKNPFVKKEEEKKVVIEAEPLPTEEIILDILAKPVVEEPKKTFVNPFAPKS